MKFERLDQPGMSRHTFKSLYVYELPWKFSKKMRHRIKPNLPGSSQKREKFWATSEKLKKENLPKNMTTSCREKEGVIVTTCKIWEMESKQERSGKVVCQRPKATSKACLESLKYRFWQRRCFYWMLLYKYTNSCLAFLFFLPHSRSTRQN